MRRILLLSTFALIGLTPVDQAAAQLMIPPPARPYTVPPTTGYYYPVQPGGFVTGNPSPWPSPWPSYDPNRPIGGGYSGTTYWDPYRGWVTHSNQTRILNSAASPGRAPMPGTTIQNYTYWNGYQWVQGQRWLGQDGQWHGVNTDTQTLPNGSTNSNTTIYMARPDGQGQSQGQGQNPGQGLGNANRQP